MGILITSDVIGEPPFSLAVTLKCDSAGCTFYDIFSHPDGYIGVHGMAMKAGWLERDASEGRMWICPQCSGKARPMNEQIDTSIPAFLRRTADNQLPAFKPIVYSYTLLKTADTCLHKAYRQYIKRDLPFDKTPEIDWGNKVHEAMEFRLGGKPLPPEMAHWEPIVSAYADRDAKSEKKTGITKRGEPTGFFDKDVWLRCKIDVTMLNNNAVFIADFKTGSSKYEDSFELEIQALTLKAAIPPITRISGHYAWLKENRIGEVHDLSDFSATWAKVNNKVEVIEDAMKSGEWPKTKNPLCGWCAVFDCEHNPRKDSGGRT